MFSDFCLLYNLYYSTSDLIRLHFKSSLLPNIELFMVFDYIHARSTNSLNV